MKKEDKEKITDALEDLKEFEVVYSDTNTYSKVFLGTSEEEIREKFENGELEFGDEDITDSEFVEDSLEIYEE